MNILVEILRLIAKLVVKVLQTHRLAFDLSYLKNFIFAAFSLLAGWGGAASWSTNLDWLSVYFINNVLVFFLLFWVCTWIGRIVLELGYQFIVGIVRIYQKIYAFAEGNEIQKTKIEEKPKNENVEIVNEEGELTDEAVAYLAQKN